MALGVAPIGALIRQQCLVMGQDLPEREALIQILQQVGVSAVKEADPTYFSWLLMYDANTDQYFLNTVIVPRNSARAVNPRGQ
jgi:hypothetical protein